MRIIPVAAFVLFATLTAAAPTNLLKNALKAGSSSTALLANSRRRVVDGLDLSAVEQMSLEELKDLMRNGKPVSPNRIPIGLANGRVIETYVATNRVDPSLEPFVTEFLNLQLEKLWYGKLLMETICGGDKVNWYLNLFEPAGVLGKEVAGIWAGPGTVRIEQFPNPSLRIDDKPSYVFAYNGLPAACSDPQSVMNFLNGWNIPPTDRVIDDMREVADGVFLGLVYDRETWTLLQSYYVLAQTLLPDNQLDYSDPQPSLFDKVLNADTQPPSGPLLNNPVVQSPRLKNAAGVLVNSGVAGADLLGGGFAKGIEFITPASRPLQNALTQKATDKFNKSVVWAANEQPESQTIKKNHGEQ